MYKHDEDKSLPLGGLPLGIGIRIRIRIVTTIATSLPEDLVNIDTGVFKCLQVLLVSAVRDLLNRILEVFARVDSTLCENVSPCSCSPAPCVVQGR